MYAKVKRIDVSSDYFSPIVLKSSYLSTGMEAAHGSKFDVRFVYDYELEFYTDSEGEMLLGDTMYPLRKGDIAFRRPGEVTQGILPYNCYLICFDLMGNMEKNVACYDLRKEQDLQPNYINEILDAIPAVFHAPNEDKYRFLFEETFNEFVNGSEGAEVLLKSLVLQILYNLYRDLRTSLHSKLELPLSHKVAIKKSCEYMRKNMKEKLNLDSIGNESGLSPFYFHKLFVKTMSITPGRYLTRLRLDRAKELLANTSLPVSQVADECGFENFPYFCCCFKKNIGTTPLEFRNRHSYV